MATQGIVTITRNGMVIAKIVVGCNGYNARDCAEHIKHGATLLQAAELSRFGCSACLAVIARLVPEQEPTALTSIIDKVHNPLYWETFDNPTFNPRWESGICEYWEIVEVA